MTDTEPRPTALITGGNRGLGLETGRQLVAKGYRTILTARNAADGKAAAKTIGADFRPLDVTDPVSIAALADSLAADGVRLDVLVNNAAVALDGFNADVARRTIDANVYGPLRVTDALLPLVADGGTVVMVSSGVGELTGFAPAIRRQFPQKVIKALGIRGRDDLPAIDDFAGVSDRILLDAKAPAGSDRPGGNGEPFDWTLLKDIRPRVDWLLSGGLDAGNVAEALRITGAPGVDVSSGVENAPGRKDPEKIRAFIAAARGTGNTATATRKAS